MIGACKPLFNFYHSQFWQDSRFLSNGHLHVNTKKIEAIFAKHGPPPESKTAKALRLVLLHGWKVTKAAKEVGLLQPSLSRSLRRFKARENNQPKGDS